MFLFNGAWDFLNVASKFSYRSASGDIQYTYDIYGGDQDKYLNITRILYEEIVAVEIVSIEELQMTFKNGDTLSILDNPEVKSWWFVDLRTPPYGTHEYPPADKDPDFITEEEIQQRLKGW